MQQWEYRYIALTMPDQIEPTLNTLGDEGWELVFWDYKLSFILRRPFQ